MMIASQSNADGWSCLMAAVVLGVTALSVIWWMIRADARRLQQWKANRDARDERLRGFTPILPGQSEQGETGEREP